MRRAAFRRRVDGGRLLWARLAAIVMALALMASKLGLATEAQETRCTERVVFNEPLRFGLGMRLKSLPDSRVIVQHVKPRKAASKLGIRVNYEVATIGGKSVYGMRMDEITSILRHERAENNGRATFEFYIECPTPSMQDDHDLQREEINELELEPDLKADLPFEQASGDVEELDPAGELPANSDYEYKEQDMGSPQKESVPLKVHRPVLIQSGDFPLKGILTSFQRYHKSRISYEYMVTIDKCADDSLGLKVGKNQQEGRLMVKAIKMAAWAATSITVEDIIASVNGVEIDSAQTLQTALAMSPQHVRVIFTRNPTRGSHPPQEFMFTTQVSLRLSDLQQKSIFESWQGCLRVIDPSVFSQESGLQQGDFILQLEEQKGSEALLSFDTVLEKVEHGDVMNVLVLRGNPHQFGQSINLKVAKTCPEHTSDVKASIRAKFRHHEEPEAEESAQNIKGDVLQKNTLKGIEPEYENSIHEKTTESIPSSHDNPVDGIDSIDANARDSNDTRSSLLPIEDSLEGAPTESSLADNEIKANGEQFKSVERLESESLSAADHLKKSSIVTPGSSPSHSDTSSMDTSMDKGVPLYNLEVESPQNDADAAAGLNDHVNESTDQFPNESPDFLENDTERKVDVNNTEAISSISLEAEDNGDKLSIGNEPNDSSYQLSHGIGADGVEKILGSNGDLDTSGNAKEGDLQEKASFISEDFEQRSSLLDVDASYTKNLTQNDVDKEYEKSIERSNTSQNQQITQDEAVSDSQISETTQTENSAEVDSNVNSYVTPVLPASEARENHNLTVDLSVRPSSEEEIGMITEKLSSPGGELADWETSNSQVKHGNGFEEQEIRVDDDIEAKKNDLYGNEDEDDDTDVDDEDEEEDADADDDNADQDVGENEELAGEVEKDDSMELVEHFPSSFIISIFNKCQNDPLGLRMGKGKSKDGFFVKEILNDIWLEAGVELGDFIEKINDKTVLDAASLKEALQSSMDPIMIEFSRSIEVQTELDRVLDFDIKVDTQAMRVEDAFSWAAVDYLAIESLEPDAADIGLKRGDILVKVDGIQIRHEAGLLDQLRSYGSGRTELIITFRRGVSNRFLNKIFLKHDEECPVMEAPADEQEEMSSSLEAKHTNIETRMNGASSISQSNQKKETNLPTQTSDASGSSSASSASASSQTQSKGNSDVEAKSLESLNSKSSKETGYKEDQLLNQLLELDPTELVAEILKDEDFQDILRISLTRVVERMLEKAS